MRLGRYMWCLINKVFCILTSPGCRVPAGSFWKHPPLFVSSVNNFFLDQFMLFFLWWRKSWVQVAVANLSSHFCFEHQSTCVEICSQSKKWSAQSKNGGRVGTWAAWCQVMMLKSSWWAALQAKITLILKRHCRLRKRYDLTPEGRFWHDKGLISVVL